MSGELCAVTTRNIPEGAGIRELDLPVDAENGYYAASFAAYGGRIYFVEKRPGTSGDVPCAFAAASWTAATARSWAT